MLPLIHEQTKLTTQNTHIIIFILNNQKNLTTTNHKIFNILHQTIIPIFIIINKINNKKQKNNIFKFHALNINQLFPISTKHNINISDLIKKIITNLPKTPIKKYKKKHIQITIINHPNINKSTLINQLLKTKQILTNKIPNTTHNTINTNFNIDERHYTLINTTNIQHKHNIS